MTPKERKDVTVLNDSRKQRIAVGSGTTVQDVLILLQRFEQVKQYAKLLKNQVLLVVYFVKNIFKGFYGS